MNAREQSDRFVILAALAGPFAGRVALVAARFAANIVGGELHLLHVIGLPGAEVGDTLAAFDVGRAHLKQVSASAGETHKGKLTGHLAAGDPTHEILQLASRLRADLLLVGTHGRTGAARFFMGSVAEEVVRRASCPVLVVREKDYQVELAPQIEPPCPECVETQAATKGEKLWCARHSQRHPHGHPRYEIPAPFALGSSIIRPS